jgi:hypothetical protein
MGLHLSLIFLRELFSATWRMIVTETDSVRTSPGSRTYVPVIQPATPFTDPGQNGLDALRYGIFLAYVLKALDTDSKRPRR